MENTTETRAEELLHELATIAKNEVNEGAFFGFFKAEENFMCILQGRVKDLVNALINAAQENPDVEKAVVLAAKYIIESNLTK